MNDTLRNYFLIVHNIKEPKYLTQYYYLSELYGNRASQHSMLDMMKPIISNHKEIPFSQNYHTLNEQEICDIPKTVDEALALYKEGKPICISSYMIREQYFDYSIGVYEKPILTKEDEILLAKMERKASVLEFCIYITMFVGGIEGIDSNASNKEIFIVVLKSFFKRMNKINEGRFLYQFVKEFFPDFAINVYGVLEYALEDEELSHMIYKQMRKEIEILDETEEVIFK